MIQTLASWVWLFLLIDNFLKSGFFGTWNVLCLKNKQDGFYLKWNWTLYYGRQTYQFCMWDSLNAQILRKVITLLIENWTVWHASYMVKLWNKQQFHNSKQWKPQFENLWRKVCYFNCYVCFQEINYFHKITKNNLFYGYFWPNTCSCV